MKTKTLMMIEANNLIAPIAGFIIVTLIGIIAFSGRSWLHDFEHTTKKILNGLEDIREQIHGIKTDIRLQNAAIVEIKTSVEMRFRSIDLRLDSVNKKITALEERVLKAERSYERLSLHHLKNHPMDKL